MFQKFYTDTLAGKYIKSLLSQTPIPLFDCVVDGDNLIKGCYYVYRRYIIQCVSSGILAVDEKENLVPSNTLYPSVFLYPGTGYKAATFYVKCLIDIPSPKTHSVFKSFTNYYDSETHYQLGRYLRYIYTTTNLNLFPFYNCYNETHFTDFELITGSNRSVTYNKTNNSKYKVVGVPILFGHTYTIALDCPSQVIMRACLHDKTGFIEDDKLGIKSDNILSNSGKIFSNMRFSDVKTFRVETDSIEWMMYQRDLYLVIQLPKNNDSSIVVLENYDKKTGITCNEKHVRKPHISNLSLLRMNTRESYAFSDRLFEYILGNVIHEGETISKNIAQVQTYISKMYSDYDRAFIKGQYRKGSWDNDISSLILEIIENSSDKNMVFDQDGNINRDAEKMLYSTKGGVINR